MEKLINGKVDMRLDGIVYKTGKAVGEGIQVKDSYKIEDLQNDFVEFLFERRVELNFDRKELIDVKVKVTRYANENVDLTKQLTEDKIKKDLDSIFATTFLFTSTLIAQITGAYGELPFVSAPSYYGEEADEDEEK